MRLSVFLKKLAALRKESQEGKKMKETEFVKDLFVSAGAKYLSDPDKTTKVSTLLKHVFSPTDGRATLPSELTDCILEGKAEYYWYAFEYLLENIDWQGCENTIYDIVANIAKDENIVFKLDPKYWNNDKEVKFDIIGSDIFKRLDNGSKNRFLSDFLLDYFYFLARWDRIFTSKFGGNFIETSSYHPDIFAMIEMHDHNNKNKKCSGYLDVNSKRLYLPKKDVSVNFYYDLTDCSLRVKLAQNNIWFCDASSDNAYFAYVDKDYLLLWKLNDTEDGFCHYKIIKNHGINISNNCENPITFNDVNDKIIITTKNSKHYVLINDFTVVETAFKLGDTDVVIDALKQIFIKENVVYRFNLYGENEKLIEFNDFSKENYSFVVNPNRVKISENLSYCIVECMDLSVWVLNNNKSIKVAVIDAPKDELQNSERFITNLIPEWGDHPTILKCMFSESEKYALILWLNNKEKYYCISIVSLEEMILQAKILDTEYSKDEFKLELTRIGTSGDEFIIPFEINKDGKRYNTIISSVMHNGEIDLRAHKYIYIVE